MSADTDRELLVLAAKAAGIEVEWGIVEQGKVLAPPEHAYYRDKVGIRWRWNPHDDSGQTLELAVMLEMQIEINGCHCWARALRGSIKGHSVVNKINTSAAMRLAIIKAAAEVGRGLASDPTQEPT